MDRMLPKADFSGAKALIHLAISNAILHPDEDEILDLVFSKPKVALGALGGNGHVSLSNDDEKELIDFGKRSFCEKFKQLGMAEIVKRLVETEDRLDMPRTL